MTFSSVTRFLNGYTLECHTQTNALFACVKFYIAILLHRVFVLLLQTELSTCFILAILLGKLN